MDERPLLLADDNLLFSSGIAAALRRLGLQVVVTDAAGQVLERARNTAVRAVLINLAARSLGSLDRVRELKADAELAAIPVIGYCGHLETDLIAAGREAGCDRVVANSAITRDPADVLRSVGIPV